MALMEDLTRGVTPLNVAIGAGVALLAPVLAPAVASVLRPAAKGIVSTGITLYRGAIEPLSAAVGDLVTEAQMELAAASATGHETEAANGAEAAHEDTEPRPRKRRGKADQ